jgi:hypothetical protein
VYVEKLKKRKELKMRLMKNKQTAKRLDQMDVLTDRYGWSERFVLSSKLELEEGALRPNPERLAGVRPRLRRASKPSDPPRAHPPGGTFQGSL